MVTIHDIAQASGKSHPTVSRALNDHPNISARTKEEIRRIARELGYNPSFAGTALKRGRTMMLSVVVPDLADPYYAEFIRCFKAVAHQARYNVVVYDYEMKKELEIRYLEMMLTGCCDGVAMFVSNFSHTAAPVARLWDAGIPLVAIGTPPDQRLKYDWVSIDMDAALNALFRRLHAEGKRKLACVTGAMSDTIFAEVAQAIAYSLKHCPLSFDPAVDIHRARVFSGCQVKDGHDLGLALLEKSPDTDTIMAWHGYQGYGVLKAVLDRGRSIPDEVALVIRDNTWVTRFSPQPVYAIDQRLDLVAEEAFAMIRSRLASPKREQPMEVVITAEAA